jgi:hypothetical protein
MPNQLKAAEAKILDIVARYESPLLERQQEPFDDIRRARPGFRFLGRLPEKIAAVEDDEFPTPTRGCSVEDLAFDLEQECGEFGSGTDLDASLWFAARNHLREHPKNPWPERAILDHLGGCPGTIFDPQRPGQYKPKYRRTIASRALDELLACEAVHVELENCAGEDGSHHRVCVLRTGGGTWGPPQDRELSNPEIVAASSAQPTASTDARGSITEDGIQAADSDATAPSPTTNDQTTARVGNVPPTKKPPKRKGRKPDTDPNADKRIYEAWKTKNHKTFADLDNEMGLKIGTSKRACDRHRKRHPRRG